MSDPLRWGLLSTALINRKIIKGASMSAEVTVQAVGSRDAARSVEYAREWGIPRAHGSYDALLADPDIDAIYISLPNGLHHEWTMRALAAGKHVLCEKPYSRHPADVAAAFDEADRRGLVLSEAFMFRYNPQIQTLAQLVREGQIGPLRLISAAFSWPTDAPGDVRLDPALDGGSLLDVGVYPLSVSRLLAGEPHSFTAQRVMGATDVDMTFVATLGFAGGVLAHFDSGFQLPDRSHLEVVGALGTIEVSDPWHCFEPKLLLTMQGEEPVTVPVPTANSYQLELEEFGRAVRKEPNQLLGRTDAEGQARAVSALLNAAAIHASLRLP
jgi:predicted dehydrogenase